MAICKCGAVLPGRRRLCNTCRAAAARRSAMRWHEKMTAAQREDYTKAPKKCPVCGAALPWEKRRGVYCGEPCAQEAKRRRSNDYNAQLRLQRAQVKAKEAQKEQDREAALSKSMQGDCDTEILQGTFENGQVEPRIRNGLLMEEKAEKKRRSSARHAKAVPLREVVRLLEVENAARKARGEEPLSYGRFVKEKGI